MPAVSEKFSPIWIGVVELAHQRRIARIVVVADRLLEPVDALAVERAAARQRVGEPERLVVVDHDGDAVADALAHRVQRGEVFLAVSDSRAGA